MLVAEVLPHSSVAEMEKVRLVPQAEPTSTCETLMLATVQLSVATTSAATLASVGNRAGLGLQPKLVPGGTFTSTGAFVFIVQE